jgi:hypothetical protein
LQDAANEKLTDHGPSEQLPGSGRLPDGRFAPGNTEALTHGLRSVRVQAGQMAAQKDALDALPERISAIVESLGGADNLSPLAHGEVRRHGKLELIEAFCWQRIETAGPFTTKGTQRACVSLWLQIHDRLARSAQALGLDRRAKDIRRMSVQDWIEHEQQQRQPATHTTEGTPNGSQA